MSTHAAGWTAARALTAREFVRLGRQPARIAASIGTPLLVWAFLAGGLSGSVVLGSGVNYGAFLVPGVATMIVLFSTIFSSISLIQDRQSGFLQAVMVSEAPAWSVVSAKVLGGSVLATAQAAMVLLAASARIPSDPGLGGLLAAVGALWLTSIALIGLGLTLAWRVNSTAGFHGVMNMLLMPMWLLSGALFPIAQSAGWIAWLARANPLSWCVKAIAGPLGIPHEGSVWSAWAVSVAFAAAMFAAAASTVGRPSSAPAFGATE